MEPFTFLVNETLRNVSQGVSTSNDARVEEELPNTHDDLLDNDSDICYSQDIYNVPISKSIFISDYELNTNVQSLKKKQRKVFDVVHDCEKRSVKNSSSVLTCVIEPFHIFLTGNSGCGKSFLTKVLYQPQAKTFSY